MTVAVNKIKDKKKQVQTFEVTVPDNNAPLVLESADLMRRADKVTIKTEKGAVAVQEMLTEVKTYLAQVKADKEQFLKPIKDAAKPLEKYFKGITDNLTVAERALKRALGQWVLKKAQDQRDLMEVLESTKSEVPAALMEKPSTRMATAGANIGATTVWTFTVDNVEQLPLDILRAAVSTIRGRAGLEEIIRGRIDGGIRAIPGVTIKEDVSISIRLTD